MRTPASRSSLTADLRALGVRPGGCLMVHAALRSVGPVLGGADDVVRALLDAVGRHGTVLGYTDWEAPWLGSSGGLGLLDDAGRLPEHQRHLVTPFDPASSRAARENGALPELLRTVPGARRSANPGASVTAVGAEAVALTSDHPLDHGYGPGSPLARLVEREGQVLLLGAPRDTLTLLHHAEAIAPLVDKRVARYDVPLLDDAGATWWRRVEEFDTARPVVAGLADDFFATVVDDFLAAGHGATGRVGEADCVLVDAARIVPFAVAWLVARQAARG